MTCSASTPQLSIQSWSTLAHCGTCLTAARTKALESLQLRAIKIVFPDNDYSSSLAIAEVETLTSRWDSSLSVLSR